MANLQEPLIRTPFTDVSATLLTSNRSKHCNEIELKLLYCMEAYGNPLGVEKCKALRQDLDECIFKLKQVGNAVLIDKRVHFKNLSWSFSTTYKLIVLVTSFP